MKPSKNILLVEDDSDDQAFFIEALNEIKNVNLIGIAGNGRQALEKLENYPNQTDIIFMDINMPVMNGIECLERIMKNPKTKEIPVVILSTAAVQADLARDLGAKAFIKKPFDATTLRLKVEQMINLDFIADKAIAAQTFQALRSAF